MGKKNWLPWIIGGTVAAALIFILICAGAVALLIVFGKPTPQNAMTLAAFQAAKPKAPSVFTIDCQIQPERDDGRRHVRLSDADGTMMEAYAAKESPEGKEVYQLLQDGREQTLTLTLQYQPGDDYYHARIVKVGR